ncbi:MAG TPA: FkbM family methyltransferase [Flavisolibacter sp.]|jgi:FkbM family methyltransferase|nr:FkbM family methyltransferase [Flavisolibacter sp.]
MGILAKLLKPTPFYNYYREFIKKRAKIKHIRLESELHPLRVEFYKQFLKPSDTVFDVGANIGNRVSAFIECGAKVIAVEPQPACVGILKTKFGYNITIENVGLSETVGELDMHISTDTTVSSFSEEYIDSTKGRFKYSKWVETIKVPITTLDNLIAKYGIPKFCKIDVEGYELQVLKGLHHPLPFLSIEYCVPEMHAQLLQVVKYLHELSPDGQFNYSVGESMKWALPLWMNYADFILHTGSLDFTKTSFGDVYFKSSKSE